MKLIAKKTPQSHYDKMKGTKNVSYKIFAEDRDEYKYTIGHLGYNGDTGKWNHYCGVMRDIGFDLVSKFWHDKERKNQVFDTAAEALADFRAEFDLAEKEYNEIREELLAIPASGYSGDIETIDVKVGISSLNDCTHPYKEKCGMVFELPVGIVFAILERANPDFFIIDFSAAKLGGYIKWVIHHYTDAYSLVQNDRVFATSDVKGQFPKGYY